MSGHHRQAQAAGPGRDGGRADRLREEAVLEQSFAEGHGIVGLTDHQRDDLSLRSAGFESLLSQPRAQRGGVRAELLDPLRALLEELECRRGCGNGRGRRRGREDERSRRVHQEVDQLGRSADVGAVSAQSLPERPDDHVHLARQSRRGDRAASPGAETAGGVRLVDHEPAPMPARQVREIRERGHVAVHREDTVGDDQ